MKPTKASTLIFATFGFTIFGFVAARVLVNSSLPIPVSRVNLLVSIPAIAVTLLLLALPVWRYRRALKQLKPSAPRPKRVDPFYAVRLLLLAKASSISATAFLGWHVGVMIAQVLSPVLAVGSVLQNGWGVVGSILLLVAALLVEWICRTPDDGDASKVADPTAPKRSEAAAA